MEDNLSKEFHVVLKSYFIKIFDIDRLENYKNLIKLYYPAKLEIFLKRCFEDYKTSIELRLVEKNKSEIKQFLKDELNELTEIKNAVFSEDNESTYRALKGLHNDPYIISRKTKFNYWESYKTLLNNCINYIIKDAIDQIFQLKKTLKFWAKLNGEAIKKRAMSTNLVKIENEILKLEQYLESFKTKEDKLNYLFMLREDLDNKVTKMHYNLVIKKLGVLAKDKLRNFINIFIEYYINVIEIEK